MGSIWHTAVSYVHCNRHNINVSSVDHVHWTVLQCTFGELFGPSLPLRVRQIVKDSIWLKTALIKVQPLVI